MAVVAVLGGLLGILMMIPLRRALIVKEHGILKYPEGTACAAVLKAGASVEDRAAASPAAQREMQAAQAAGTGAATGGQVIFAGFGVGLIYKIAYSALRLWKDIPEKIFGAPLKAGSLSVEISPELLGVGYIIGPRIGSIMCAGGVLSYLVLIPMIKFFGEGNTGPLTRRGPCPSAPCRPMTSAANTFLYIGAGAVAAGGLISLARSLPTIWHGLRAGLRDMGANRADNRRRRHPAHGPRLAHDLRGHRHDRAHRGHHRHARSLHMNILGALLIIVFGFLFVTVSSRLTGEIGSSSNPISGMTIATLLFTCLIFLCIGWTGNSHYVTALSVGAIVCIAASNGGTTSQDLKTGFLVGSTPRLKQIAILFGAFASALVLGPILLVLNEANATVYVPVAQVAPAGLGGRTRRTLTVHEKLRRRAGAQRPQAITSPGKKPTTRAARRASTSLTPTTGKAVWLVDPGINGKFTTRPDGSRVEKFHAPKAVLVSYIIKGILDRKLPWALVLFRGDDRRGAGNVGRSRRWPSRSGVYLPISSSTPIFVGGHDSLAGGRAAAAALPALAA